MSRFYYENQGTNTYLVYSIDSSDKVDTMTLGMLANNKISGLAATIFTQIDTTKLVKYNVTARVSASQLFEGCVNRKRLLGVFSGIVDAMLSAEDYMIDPNSILLQLDYIFVDVSTCDTVLICLPILGANTEALNLGTFFKSIMFRTQFDQTENCDYVAKIINYLNSVPNFSLSDFKKVLESVSGAATKPQAGPRAPTAQPSVPVAPRPQMAQMPVRQAPVSAQPAYRPAPQVPVQQQMPQRPQVPVQPQAPARPIPQQPAPVRPQNVTVQTGDEISLFYLLQHYNKENAARYKAQKEAKKQQTGEAAPQPKQKKKKKEAAPPNYTVPGAPQGPSFAIPGQARPITGYNAPSPTPVQPQPVQRPAAQVYAPQAQPAVRQQPIAQQPVMQVQYAQVQTAPMSFGETTVLGGGTIGETTVLGMASQNAVLRPHLIRMKNNEWIDVNKPVFRIGKEKSYVDYFIGDNTAVSRSHANVITRDGEFFIVDTNSTNHTYIDGTMILSNTETKLSHGTKIRLANEEFEFRLY